MSTKVDFIVVGAGIAGISAAAELAANATVVIIEREVQPGFHATGRSAAYFAPAYGNETVRGISAACEQFFSQPPGTFTDVALLRPRPSVFIGRADQQAAITDLRTEIATLQPMDAEAVCRAVPILDPRYVATGLLDPDGGDLDVDALLQGYLRLFRRRGGRLVTDADIGSLSQQAGVWVLSTATETVSAPVIVNAAGAWADSVAALAGVGPLGITPMRRTAVLLDAPAGHDITDWPLTIDVDEQFYFKPDAGQLLVSPADETPSEPGDAQAEDLDVAIAVDRFSQATGLEVTRVRHRWAGLRSFAADRTFVVGRDPRHEGFFWLAGQGGYGVQSAPALALLTSHLLTGAPLAGAFAEVPRFAAAVAPDRLI